MYAEYDEPEFTFACYDGSNPIDREIYQIFINIWENGKAFSEYWKALPLSKPEVQRQEARQEESQALRRTQTARARQRVHQRVLQSAREEAQGLYPHCGE
jgi:hypothetical protein